MWLWLTRLATSGGTGAVLSLCGYGEAVMPLRMVEGGVAEEWKVDGGVFEDSAADRSSSVGACCMLYPCPPNEKISHSTRSNLACLPAA
jgi:hypothetical protein